MVGRESANWQDVNRQCFRTQNGKLGLESRRSNANAGNRVEIAVGFSSYETKLGSLLFLKFLHCCDILKV
jgi:hypothetical protein